MSWSHSYSGQPTVSVTAEAATSSRSSSVASTSTPVMRFSARKSRDVVLEAAAQAGGQALVVVVALEQDAAPLVRERERAGGPAAGRAPAEGAMHRDAEKGAGGEARARPRPAPREGPEPRSGPPRRRRPPARANGRPAGRDPHRRASAVKRRASRRPRTRASTLPPVTTTATGRPSSRRTGPRGARPRPPPPTPRPPPGRAASRATIASSISASVTLTTSSMRSRCVEDDLADAAGQAVGEGRPGRVVEERPGPAQGLAQGGRGLGLHGHDAHVRAAGLDRGRDRPR